MHLLQSLASFGCVPLSRGIAIVVGLERVLKAVLKRRVLDLYVVPLVALEMFRLSPEPRQLS